MGSAGGSAGEAPSPSTDFARASAKPSEEAVEEEEEEEEEEEDPALRFHTVPSSTSNAEVDSMVSVVSTTRVVSSNVSRVKDTSTTDEFVDSEEPSSAGGEARTRVAVRIGRRSFPELRMNSDLWPTSAPEGATRRRNATPGRRRASALASGTLGASAEIDAISRVLVRGWARARPNWISVAAEDARGGCSAVVQFVMNRRRGDDRGKCRGKQSEEKNHTNKTTLRQTIFRVMENTTT